MARSLAAVSMPLSFFIRMSRKKMSVVRFLSSGSNSNSSPEEQQDTEAAMLCFWQSAWISPQSSSRMASLSSQMQIWIIGWFPPFPF